MDSAHLMLLYIAASGAGHSIRQYLERRRKLTGGEVRFLWLGPVLIAACLNYLIETSSFPDWYRADGPHSVRDLAGTFAIMAAAIAAVVAAWLLFAAFTSNSDDASNAN